MENSIRIRYNTDELFLLNNLPQGEKERLIMSNIEQQVKKIVAEQLGVNEAEWKTNLLSKTIWVLTLWTP